MSTGVLVVVVVVLVLLAILIVLNRNRPKDADQPESGIPPHDDLPDTAGTEPTDRPNITDR